MNSTLALNYNKNGVQNRNYGLCPVENSWEEFVMLSCILSRVSHAISVEEKIINRRRNKKRKRKRSNSESSEDSESIDDEDEREIKRLKKIENRLKRKYQEFMYG